MSHLEAMHNEAIVKARGFRRVEGWDQHRPNYPGRSLDEQHAYDWEAHCYMLKHKRVPTVYVSEPYDLESEDFAELAELVKDGWHVQITEGLALYYPGHTIPIWITWDNDSTDYNLLSSLDVRCDPNCVIC